MTDRIITLDYGSGGKKTSDLIENLIVPRFQNEALCALGDGAVLSGEERIVFSTDSFVVTPRFFPGGDIGKLAVCGTVNDIAMAGGEPKYISLSAIIEEGFSKEELEKILDSAALAAKEAGVSVVTGDTKVVEKGKCDGIYLNTSGIGFLRRPGLSPDAIHDGDRIIVSGTVGDHGLAVMLARNENLVNGAIESDCAPLNKMAQALYELGEDLRVLRDPTRGGLVTTLCEFAEGREFTPELDGENIPVKPQVSAASDILGLDPLYAACEGKLIAVVSKEKAGAAVEILKGFEYGRDAAIIGEVTASRPGKVIIKTRLGGARIAAKLSGAQLPRIC